MAVLKLGIHELNVVITICFKALVRIKELQYHLVSARYRVLHRTWSQNGGIKGNPNVEYCKDNAGG